MKISTNLMFQRALDQMGDSQNKLSKLQAELSSGKSVVNPSDKPQEATTIQRIKSVISRQDKFMDTITAVRTRLTTEETVLSSSTDVLTRIKELSVQASNDSYTNEDRKLIAIEIDEMIKELLSIGNSKDINGNYIFSGAKVKTPPFELTGSNELVYNGDQTRNLVNINENRQIFINRPGSDIYTNVNRTEEDGTISSTGFFQALDDISNAIKESDRDGINQGMNDLEQMVLKMTEVTAKVGASLRVMEVETEILEDTKLQLKTALSDVEDVDYAEAVTNMKKKLLSLEAAQSSFAQISRLSLFDYIGR
tara:strand:+ start:346 stop:1272 length:927 start_codon:yes stop_codon:yes gene_type:complete